MSLEILTLLVLAVVLLIKYATLKHTNALTREKQELERSCRFLDERYNLICQQREGSESDERNLRQDRVAMETLLKKLKQNLEEQEKVNEGLQNQLG